MIMMKKCLGIILVVVSVLAGCQKQASDVDQAFNVRGGNCLLKKGTDSFICFDAKADSDANTGSANCDTEFNRYNSSVGLNGKSWLSDNNNTCATATSTTVIGNCTLSTGTVVRYYGPHFNSGTAQTDCSSVHSGTWAP